MTVRPINGSPTGFDLRPSGICGALTAKARPGVRKSSHVARREAPAVIRKDRGQHRFAPFGAPPPSSSGCVIIAATRSHVSSRAGPQTPIPPLDGRGRRALAKRTGGAAALPRKRERSGLRKTKDAPTRRRQRRRRTSPQGGRYEAGSLLDLDRWLEAARLEPKSRQPKSMSEKKEPARPEARLPKGLFDTSAAEIRATERMLATIRQVFESYGFEPLDTPAIEYTDALGKFLPDQDRPNEGVFSFKDADDGEWLSLRYDLTAPLARYVAENYQSLPKPFRRYQAGPVWRNEKPGPGRFRQFTQFDADTVGASSVAADAELCMLAADTLEALGVPRGQYVVKVNNRKILDGVLDSVGRSKMPASASRYCAPSTNLIVLAMTAFALS